VIDVLAALGVFHGNLEELLHGRIISVVVIFVRVKHVFGNAHGIEYD
jgi:hypothetical protein